MTQNEKKKGRRTIYRRLMSLVVMLFLAVGIMNLSPAMIAQAENNAGDFDVTGPTTGYTYDSSAKTLTFTSSGNYTISGNGKETQEKIAVSGNDITATITLNNVNINVSATDSTSAFSGKKDSNTGVKLTIVLQGKNTLKSGRYRQGLGWSNSDDNSSLTIDGDGSLDATGGTDSAGIGGGPTKNITIRGGTVTATGGYGGAGIGGGTGNSANIITINGGIVTATGGSSGAGIGGGSNGSGNDISISGGIVTATGGNSGAGIGGGRNGSGSNITINDGTVTAKVHAGSGAGIGGGGDGGSGNNITINNGIVAATGGNRGAGIGLGDVGGSGSNITINGGTVTAIGGYDGAGIGGKSGSASNIIIRNGSVKVDGGIGAIPTDGEGHNVYKLQVKNASGINIAQIGDKTYTRAGDHPYGDGSFYVYTTGGENREVHVQDKVYYAIWNSSNSTFAVKSSTPDPEFTVKPTSNSLTVNVTNKQTEYGAPQYACMTTASDPEEGDWKTTNAFAGLSDVMKYTIYVRFTESPTYLISDLKSMQVYTLAASPVASVPAGTYTENQSIILTTATTGADIYYTTDGSTPSVEEKNKYQGAISIEGIEADSVSKTIKAIAVKDGVVSEEASFTYIINLPDITAPVVTIKKGTSSWDTFLDVIKYNDFYKTTNSFAIEATDNVGVVSTEYYVSDEKLTPSSVESITDWKMYNDAFSITEKGKKILYAKAKDAKGNETIVSTDGMVIYSDSVLETTSLTHVLTVDGDGKVSVQLKDNTIQSISEGDVALSADTDYTVSKEGIITFSSTYLEGLAVETHSLAIRYNPLGETYVAKETNDAPATSTLEVTVRKPKITEVITPDEFMVENGVTLEKMKLPSEVTIKTEDPTITKTKVEWDLTKFASGSYDPSLLCEQSFTLNGAITFPEQFDENKQSTKTQMKVTVKKGTFSALTASIKPGTYKTNQDVSLTSGTKGVVIYYTTDGSTPSETNGIKYTGAIRLEGKQGKKVIKIIKTIAVKDGIKSSIATFVYKISLSAKEPAKVSAPKVKKTGKSFVISWKKVSGATGYQVQFKKTGQKSWKNIKRVTKLSKTKWRTENYIKGRTYQYRIRAYRVVNGKKVYGKWSKVIKIKK